MNNLFGQTKEHLTHLGFGDYFLTAEAKESLLKLQEKAHQSGFDMRVCSTFRSFERQLEIWNEKINGTRPIFDRDGKKLDPSDLNDRELLWEILNWLALPGLSRHHWGTDLDWYDYQGAQVQDHRLQLTADEYLSQRGPCFSLYHWLKKNAEDFYWPFENGACGIGDEPWHISYRPQAQEFEESFSTENYLSFISKAQFERPGLSKVISEEIEKILLHHGL